MTIAQTIIKITRSPNKRYRRALAIVPREPEALEVVTADEHEIGIGDVVWADTSNLVDYGMPAGIIGNVEAIDDACDCALVRYDVADGITFSRYLHTARMTVLVEAATAA